MGGYTLVSLDQLYFASNRLLVEFERFFAVAVKKNIRVDFHGAPLLFSEINSAFSRGRVAFALASVISYLVRRPAAFSGNLPGDQSSPPKTGDIVRPNRQWL